VSEESDRKDTERAARLRDVLTVGEFRTIWLASAQSIAGDQLARVAVSILVFARTGSPAWTALSYALTFLPDLVGGPMLAGLADRYSRRAVMVTTDLIRAALVLLMAVPSLPLPAVVALLVPAQLLGSPFIAARTALSAEILPGDRIVVATALMSTTYQTALVVGFGVGAVVVTALGTSGALIADAATFVVSALLVRTLVGPHRPGSGGALGPAGWWRRWWATLRAGFRVVLGDPRLRSLIVIACISGAYVIPEGLAVPYAAQIRGGNLAVGLLLAANPAGTIVGLLAVKRLRPDRRRRLLGPLAILTCLVLVPCLWAPSVPISVALWFASGIGSAYNSIANGLFVQATPNAVRGQAVGLAQASLRVAQGVGVVAAGLVAQAMTPAVVIAIAGVVGVVLAVGATRSWTRAATSRPLGDPG
jgi:predicted MFS family arabinose efflux permease